MPNPRFVINKIEKIIFIFFSIILIVVLLFELSLRNNKQFKRYKDEIYWMGVITDYDEILGWKNIPGTSVYSIIKKCTVRYDINSKGLRDKEYDYKKQDDIFRIICLGDSITFGWNVNTEDRFSDILENKIEETEIINIGMLGYGIDQMLLMLKQEGLKYSPDLVLIYLIEHDLDRSCYSKMWDLPKPYFVFENREMVLSNVPVPNVDVFYFDNYFWKRIRSYLIKKSYLFSLIKYKIFNARTREIKVFENLENKDKLFESIFYKIKEAVESFGADLIIVGNLDERHKNFLKEKNILYCGDPLSKSREQNEEVCYPDEHPNVNGHRIIFEAIYSYMISNELIPDKCRGDDGG